MLHIIGLAFHAISSGITGGWNDFINALVEDDARLAAEVRTDYSSLFFDGTTLSDTRSLGGRRITNPHSPSIVIDHARGDPKRRPDSAHPDGR